MDEKIIKKAITCYDYDYCWESELSKLNGMEKKSPFVAVRPIFCFRAMPWLYVS